MTPCLKKKGEIRETSSLFVRITAYTTPPQPQAESQVSAAAAGAAGGCTQTTPAEVRIPRAGDLRAEEEDPAARRGAHVYLSK